MSEKDKMIHALSILLERALSASLPYGVHEETKKAAMALQDFIIQKTEG